MVEVSELRCPQELSWVGPSKAVKVIEEDFFTGSVFVTDDSFLVGEGRVFRQRLSCSFRRHAMEATEVGGNSSPGVAAALQPQAVWLQNPSVMAISCASHRWRTPKGNFETVFQRRSAT